MCSFTKLKQPTKKYKIKLTMPEQVDIILLDIWIRDVLEIDEDISVSGDDIHQVAHKALFVLKNLLQYSNIPVFYRGKIEDIINDGEQKYTIYLSVVNIDFIPEKYIEKSITYVFEIIFWMMKNKDTTKNMQIVYKNCINEILKPLSSLVPTGLSTIPILKRVYNKNIPFSHLGGGIYQIGWGSKSRKLDRSTNELDSAIGSKLSQSKFITSSLLRSAGLPASTHILVDSVSNALLAARQIGYPVVIKPDNLDRSEGVTVNVFDDKKVIEASQKALELSVSKQILVEKQVEGTCHRVFISQNQLLYVRNRLPVSIEGDGARTIAEIIEQENIIQSNRPPWLRNKLLPNDELTKHTVELQGLKLDSIPKKGIKISLRDIESAEWGGCPDDVTDIIHKDNIDIAVRASKLFGLNVAGIDIITTDISKPWYETSAVINEVNYAPMLKESTKKYISIFVERFIDGNGRIPVEIYVKDDDKAFQKAKKRQQEIIQKGSRCFLSTKTETFDNFNQKIYFSTQNIFKRTKALFFNTNVDAIVLLVESEKTKIELLNYIG